MKALPPILLVAVLATMPLSRAANVVIDPATFTGTNAINPLGRTLTTATNATALATLEAVSGLQTVHDFAFTGTQTLGEQYIFDFTTSGALDVRFQYSGTLNVGSSTQVTNSTYSTSASSTLRLGVGGNNTTMGLRIDFGAYDSDSGLFTANGAVDALGFTLPNAWKTEASTVTISYYDSSDGLLSQQTLLTSTTDSTNGFGYTGFVSSGTPISYMLLSFASSSSAPVLTLDDLSYAPAAVPEPGVVSLMLLGGLALLRRRR